MQKKFNTLAVRTNGRIELGYFTNKKRKWFRLCVSWKAGITPTWMSWTLIWEMSSQFIQEFSRLWKLRCLPDRAKPEKSGTSFSPSSSPPPPLLTVDLNTPTRLRPQSWRCIYSQESSAHSNQHVIYPPFHTPHTNGSFWFVAKAVNCGLSLHLPVTESLYQTRGPVPECHLFWY